MESSKMDFPSRLLSTLLILKYLSLDFLSDTFGTYLPTEKDLDEALFLTAWIENETAQDMIFHYLVLCPEQDMCLGPEFKRNFSFMATPACTTCDCDDSCVRKATCCPSKFYRQTNTPDFIEYDESSKHKDKEFIPLSCMEPLWNSEGIASGKAYWIVKTCPNGTDCLHRSMSSTNITNYTPVTSVATNETYVNFHCAFCNQEHMQNLIPWEKKLICMHRSSLFSSSDAESLSRATFGPNPNCNIGFHPSGISQAIVQSCQEYTSEYNCKNANLPSSRLNAYLTQACHKYHLPFFAFGIIYRNIFCALCETDLLNLNIVNNPEFFGVNPFSELVFSALLNFQETKKPVKRSNGCAENQILDKKLDTCLTVHCEEEYSLHNTSCTPVHTILAENNYEINLIILPIEKPEFVSFDFDAFEVSEHLRFILSVHNLTDYLCRMSVLIPDESDAVFMAVVIELSVYIHHNVDLMIENLLDIFNSYKTSPLFSNHQQNAINISLSIVGQRFHLYGDQLFEKRWESRFYVNPMSGKEMALFHSVDMLSESGTEIKHCLINNMLSVVADWYRCPKIKIRTADAKLDVSNFSVCLTEYDVCFSSTYFKESSDKRSVEVCLDKYLQAFKAINNPLVSSNGDSLEYLSLVCLSVSSLGSLATILTFCVSGPSSRLADINIIILAVLIILANTTHTVSKLFLWSETLCIGLGILVHFCWLSVVCWMSLSSFQIFQTFTSFTIVKIKVSSRVTYCLMINVMICLSLIAVNAVVSYIRTNFKNIGYSPQTCYIADPDMVLFTFALPVGLFVCINIFMFAVTVYRISKRINIQKSKNEKKMGAYFRLSTITGASWLFGFLYQFTGFQPFSILHTVFNGGQGLLLYLAFGLSRTAEHMFSIRSRGPKK